jgi:hypothetical protein
MGSSLSMESAHRYSLDAKSDATLRYFPIEGGCVLHTRIFVFAT